jgi:hypothetical protein
VGCLFVIDLCRNDEGIMTDDALKQKWQLSNETVAEIPNSVDLMKAFTAEKERRMLEGVTVREQAAFQLVKAPGAAAALGHMLHDKLEASARKIDASKELRAMAASGGDRSAAAGEKWVITINVGGGRPPIVAEHVKQLPLPNPHRPSSPSRA